MTNEIKNVPELRFPEFKEEWVEKKLGEITSKISDGIHSTPTYDSNGDIYFINGNNLVNGRIDFKTSKKISVQEFNKYKNYLEAKNTLLLSINGTIGNIAKYEGENILLGKSAAYINVVSKFISRCYIFYYLQTSKIYESFLRELTGTTIKNLSLKSIKNIIVYISELDEQQKIGNFFSKLDRQIELEEQKLSLLEEQKKGYMQKIFSQELRFKDESGNEYPEWEEKKLFDVVKYLSSKRSSNYYSEDIIHGQYPVYDAVQEISRDTNFDIEESYISILKDGAGVGRLNLRPGKSSVIGTMGYLLPQNIDIKFLFYYLKTMNFNRFVIGSTIPHLYFKDYSKETLLIPIDKSEQIKIGSFFIKLDRIINNKAKKIKVLKQRKQGFLQKMFV
ncbi:restriction endonuclease subunit S [Staphylococcus xylosus]